MGLDMKKLSEGLVAAGVGTTLLVGGAGTLAFWTEDVTVGGGAINAGHLNLVTDATNVGCGSWKLDAGEAPVLAGLVRLERAQVAVELVELEPRVVEPLRGLLGLVVEPVDAGLHVVDVGLGLGR